MAQKWPKSDLGPETDFEDSGSPKRLERRGAKLDLVTGRPGWVFGSMGSAKVPSIFAQKPVFGHFRAIWALLGRPGPKNLNLDVL